MCKENALINLEFEGRKLDYIIGEDGEPYNKEISFDEEN